MFERQLNKFCRRVSNGVAFSLYRGEGSDLKYLPICFIHTLQNEQNVLCVYGELNFRWYFDVDGEKKFAQMNRLFDILSQANRVARIYRRSVEHTITREMYTISTPRIGDN